MKQIITQWGLRLAVTGLLLIMFLMSIVLNPTLLYAHKTIAGKYTVYNNSSLDNEFILQLYAANNLLKTSELFDAHLKLDICLNDGSYYPVLMEKLRGQAFGWGFANKVVLMGDANYKNNYVALNGYRWNLTQLIAHEVTHCMQFNKLGLLHSNPVSNYPNWKWEGYPEYVARRNADQLDLSKNIQLKIASENADKDGWAVTFSDSTIAPREYYNAWLIVQYCLDIKKMTYKQLLADTTGEQQWTNEMMQWYAKKIKN